LVEASIVSEFPIDERLTNSGSSRSMVKSTKTSGIMSLLVLLQELKTGMHITAAKKNPLLKYSIMPFCVIK
jgi:hypothetical protein